MRRWTTGLLRALRRCDVRMAAGADRHCRHSGLQRRRLSALPAELAVAAMVRSVPRKSAVAARAAVQPHHRRHRMRRFHDDRLLRRLCISARRVSRQETAAVADADPGHCAEHHHCDRDVLSCRQARANWQFPVARPLPCRDRDADRAADPAGGIARRRSKSGACCTRPRQQPGPRVLPRSCCRSCCLACCRRPCSRFWPHSTNC